MGKSNVMLIRYANPITFYKESLGVQRQFQNMRFCFNLECLILVFSTYYVLCDKYKIIYSISFRKKSIPFVEKSF